MDPELAALVPVLPELDLADFATSRAMLAAFAGGGETADRSSPEGVVVSDRHIPGPPGAPEIPVRIYRPDGDGIRPALVYFHGGGFVLGQIEMFDTTCTDYATAAGVVVISVDYRLAPEDPFPAGVEDCYAALQWTVASATDLAVDPAAIAVGGASAGGALAAAVALMARDRGGPAIAFQLLAYPVLDDRLETASVRGFTDTPLWNSHHAATMWDLYLGPERRHVSPYAAPARATDLCGLPPAYVLTCELDPLRDEGIAYAQGMLHAGVPVELHNVAGAFHGFDNFPTAISRAAAAEQHAALRRALYTAPPMQDTVAAPMTSDTRPTNGSDDTPAEASVRAQVRAFMDEHAAPLSRRNSRIPALVHDDIAASRTWQRVLDDHGWGAPGWPVEFGGKGYGPNELRIFREEEQRYQVPSAALHTSIAMVGPTIIAHGTDDQRERYLPAIRRGELIWCQLFSEPDAGSDLASLRTAARRVDGGWLVTGQKIWTSGAHYSDRAILLARTDPDAGKHDAITYLLADMRSPGVEVRPIVQINRAAHFNQVYLDGLFVPDDDVLGPTGGGWTVARTTLSTERVMISSIRVDDRVEALIDEARRLGRTTEPDIRQQLADAVMRASVLRLTSDRVLAALRTGGTIGPEASVLKLSLSTLMGRLGNLAMTVLGPQGLLEGGDGGYGPLQDRFLAQWAPRIGGGTEQIQRNLIGERALGLPREPVVDGTDTHRRNV